MEVYGGICGLKGHSSKRETTICLVIACYCVFAAVQIIAFEPNAIPECIEYAVSGVVAFLLWHYGRATIALHAATQRETGDTTTPSGRVAATREDYALGLKVVGGILVLFSLWSVVQAALGFFYPSLLGFRSDELDLMDPAIVFIMVIFAGVVEIVLSLAQMHIGYLAYKLSPTKSAVVICAIFFILTVIGILSRILSSGSTTLDDFAEVSCAGTMLLYLIYCKKLNTLEREARSAA